MKAFQVWFKENPGHLKKPWLVLGKGPSFRHYDEYGDVDCFTLALNHVVQDISVDLAHCIDIEVIEHCGETILKNARYLVMPWVPHVKGKRGLLYRTYFGPGSHTLADYCHSHPVLKSLADQQRLLWYNLASAPSKLTRKEQPVVDAKGFSASAVVNLLASVGVKQIRTLGIDGGNSYSEAFDKLRDVTLLPTRHQSFDLQFRSISQTIFHCNINLEPLNMEAPIAVYVGTQPEQELATKVLEYSIRRNASMAVRVEPLYEAVEKANIDIPTPVAKAQQPKTPFSFQRFAIPQLKNFQGRAIYLDSDMQVFQDIRKIWEMPFNGAEVLSVNESKASGRRPQFSVMLLDCGALRWDPSDLIRGLDEGRWSYQQLMYEMCAAERVSDSIPACWNELERYHRDYTALTHYTEMNTQPWLSTQNLLGKIWCQELFDAIESEFIDKKLLQAHIDRGWVRPSLMYQLEHRIVDPLLLPGSVVRDDKNIFVLPHRTRAITHKLTGFGQQPNQLQQQARKLYARSRQLIEASQLRPTLGRVKRKLLG